MEKNAIKKYAVQARRELLSRVSQKALQYGISEKEIADKNADTVNGHLLSPSEKKQRRSLIAKIKKDGYEQAMETAAYTWFNRFSALRFMEVNGYLPSHVRVFTDDQNAFKPQIITEAIHLELDGLDMEKVYDLKDANKTDELYKYLLITQCNALGKILPGMFTRIEDYTELLFPDNLLREGSVIEQMIAMIPEDDWKDAVQIIGWLYQYYNAEPKEKVFADLKKNIKISKEKIPAATQLFTPDWIVRYMVENSLGRLWIEGHPDSKAQFIPTKEEQDAYIADKSLEDGKWHYFLEEAEQEADVQIQLEKIRKEYATLKPEDIHCIDPCMGSGHILVYMFDVLVQIYESYGYNAREAAGLILQNNLYGLDIDDRAAQLAYFAVMMKARKVDRRIFSRGIQPHVYAIMESGYTDEEGNQKWNISPEVIDYVANGNENIKTDLETLKTELFDAKEYGSILNITQIDFAAIYARLDEIKEEISIFASVAQSELRPLVEVAEVMAQKYHVVVTNPPYMGGSGMSGKLSEYVKKNYYDSKSDLFAVFIEKCGQMVILNGYQAMITQHAWMFLSSFEKLRIKQFSFDIVNMAHLGARAFEEIGGEVVQTTSFVMCRSRLNDYQGTYCRLIDPTTQQGKEDMFLARVNSYKTKHANFSKIPGSPVAYWVSDRILSAYERGILIGDCADVKIGMGTGKNEIFVREWWEVCHQKIDFSLKSVNDLEKSAGRYFPYNKGGEFRLWYGNLQEVLWFDTEGRKYMNTMSGHRENGARDYYCKEGLTWSFISSSKFGVRYLPSGCFYDVAGSTLFSREDQEYILGFLSSCVCFEILSILNPTLNYQAGNIKSLPILVDRASDVNRFVGKNIQISKQDWDAFENSWDFKRHPLITFMKDEKHTFVSVKTIFEQIDSNVYIRNPSLETAKKFIKSYFDSCSKKCVFNVEFTHDESIFSRSEHMVSCYLIGKYIYQSMGVISDSFDNKYFPELSGLDFDYLWFLCCLSHDLLSKYEKEYENVTYTDLDDFIAKHNICHTIYSPNLPEDIQFVEPFFHTYSEDTIREYFSLRQCDGKIDHGIAEGYLLFDLLVKNYLSASSKNEDKRNFETHEANGHTLLWRKNQIWAFALVADAVISHNIWHKSEKELSPHKIPEITIGNEKERKLSVLGNPLAFLFGIVDSLEPLKFFKPVKKSADIFNSIKMGIGDDTIVFRSTYPLDDWYQSKFSGLSDWISSVETAFTNNEIRLSFGNYSLKLKYAQWVKECNSRFNQLKTNEEELNKIFIDIYGLQDELTPDVADKDITVHRVYDTKDDVPESMKGSNYVRTMRDEIVSLISYAVGCMFGRYSTDVEGLILAGQPFSSRFISDPSWMEDGVSTTLAGDYIYIEENKPEVKLCTFMPDKDNVLPICDDEYFDDDIVGRFIQWVSVVYGEDTLEENLKFIADALGGKGQPREVIRHYFLNDFYKDHCRTYQKRPIYWLFDSGKKNGFKALIYMHRYQPDTIARIRTDYVHEQQARYRTAIEDLEKRILSAVAGERVKLSKQLKKLKDQAEEIRLYEEKIHHLADQMIRIDLDDGVKVNYAKFEDVLAKIK